MQSIVIEKGKVFIEGVETLDPILIGYAILDLVQDEEKTIVLQEINLIKA